MGVAAHVIVEAAVGVVIVARSDEEVMALLGSGVPLDKARQLFSSWSARIETLSVQRTPLSPIDMRRMEFEAVEAIAKALNENR